LVVRLLNVEGLLDPQGERTSHTPGDVATQVPEATCHRAPCPTGAPVDTLAHLEGRML
jgi:hypothetical protein